MLDAGILCTCLAATETRQMRWGFARALVAVLTITPSESRSKKAQCCCNT
jgi:hypothetical protein